MPSRTAPTRQAVMSDVFYLILRRMRFPLLLVIGVYAVCSAGLAMIPGTDANGDPAPSLTIFEAVYVVSYTSTTIGFGEVPGPYNAAQRMWMIVTIYVSVAAWTYSLLNVIGLLQDQGFQNAVRIARFARRVGQLREPFYIVCGIGETGRLVCHGLDHLGLRFVGIDQDSARIQQLRLDEFSVDPPTVEGNASQPGLLEHAGLLNPYCRGVVALTDDDRTNQAIAVTVKLLSPRVPVLARIRDAETETHIGVFGGDVVINPFERFAEYLAAAIAAPERYRLREMLTSLAGSPVVPLSRPPKGHWIMCGYGRFGHEVTESLRAAGMDISVVDNLHYDEGGVDVKGSGISSEDLKAAGIDRAVGLVTGNASDTKNLAIAVTARALNHDLYIINRQNVLNNYALFEAFDQDLLMVPSRIVAQEFLARITTPMLNRFLRLIPQRSEAQCSALYAELAKLDPGRHPEVWDLVISQKHAPALTELTQAGGLFTVGHLRADPFDRSRRMHLMVLLVRRGNRSYQLPADDLVLCPEDRLLLAGSPLAKRHVKLTLDNPDRLNYVLTGQETRGGAIWRWLTRKHPPKVVPLSPQDMLPPRQEDGESVDTNHDFNTFDYRG
ncbi:MAG: potassium channel protein [Brooklawnia sp.]|nr:potassium channel protein [Brooklawnia sp.]